MLISCHNLARCVFREIYNRSAYMHAVAYPKEQYCFPYYLLMSTFLRVDIFRLFFVCYWKGVLVYFDVNG